MLDIFDFPQRLARLHTVAAVIGELMPLTEPHGFTIYAIGAVPHPDLPYPTRFMVTNWPEIWRVTYFDRRFGERDPTLRAMKTHGHAFTISDLRAGRCGFLPSADETEMLDFAASIGAPEGFLVPVFRANGYSGFACLSGKGPDPAPAVRARLQFALEHAHDRLRLLCAQHPEPGENPPLTPREIEILSLARKGMGDSAISQATGISIRTVRFHFENARHKLGARSRAEAVALAVSRYLLPG